MKMHEAFDRLQANGRHNFLRGRRLPFKFGVIATLAIAVGANVAVLGNLGVLFGQVVPGAEHQDLYVAYYGLPAKDQLAGPVSSAGIPSMPRPIYRDFAAALAGHAQTALYEPRAGDLESVSGGAQEEMHYLIVSPTLASVLGVHPVAGRGFVDADTQSGAAPVVMIAARVARARLGGVQAAIGKMVELDGTTRRVVGILPDALVFPEGQPASAWIPLPPATPASAASQAVIFNTHVLVLPVGVLGPAAVRTTLQNAVHQTLPALSESVRNFYARFHYAPGVGRLAQFEFAGIGPQLQLLEIAAVVLLLLVLANLAGLAVTDALSRRHELAVRVALGARPWRLYVERLRELLLLALVAWAAGVGLGWMGSRAIASWVGQAGAPMTFSAPVLFLTLAAAVTVALVLALTASVRLRAQEHVGTDLGAGAQTSRGRNFTLTLRALVVIQLAASLALLVTTAHLQSNVFNLQHADFGFQPRHRIFFSVAHEIGNRHAGAISRKTQTVNAGPVSAFDAEFLRQLDTIAGVQSAATLTSVPLTGGGDEIEVSASLSGPRVLLQTQWVSAYAAGALGLHTLAGNTANAFLPDSQGAFLDESAARRLWPQTEPGNDVGKNVYLGNTGDTPVRVTAITRAVQVYAYEPPVGTVFMSPGAVEAAFGGNLPASFVVHSAIPPRILRSIIARQLARLDPHATITEYTSGDAIVSRAYAGRNRLTRVFAVVALVTLLIATVGLFALLAYRTLSRRPELAIRSALGASPRRLFAYTLAEAAALWLMGCVTGMPVAYALSIELAHRLPAYGSVAAWLAAAVTVGLGVVSLLAALVPALWSSCTAPAVILRQG